MTTDDAPVIPSAMGGMTVRQQLDSVLVDISTECERARDAADLESVLEIIETLAGMVDFGLSIPHENEL